MHIWYEPKLEVGISDTDRHRPIRSSTKSTVAVEVDLVQTYCIWDMRILYSAFCCCLSKRNLYATHRAYHGYGSQDTLSEWPKAIRGVFEHEPIGSVRNLAGDYAW
jgi:hypothetical protein